MIENPQDQRTRVLVVPVDDWKREMTNGVVDDYHRAGWEMSQPIVFHRPGSDDAHVCYLMQPPRPEDQATRRFRAHVHVTLQLCLVVLVLIFAVQVLALWL